MRTETIRLQNPVNQLRKQLFCHDHDNIVQRGEEAMEEEEASRKMIDTVRALLH